MQKEFLSKLICPFCSSDIEPYLFFKQNKKQIVNAIVKCNCSTHPIVDGILIYHSPNSTTKLPRRTQYIRYFVYAYTIYFTAKMRLMSHKMKVAMFTIHYKMFEYFSPPVIRKKIFNLLSAKQHTHNKRQLTFCKLLEYYEKYFKRDFTYFIHRFSLHTFWGIYVLLPLLLKSSDDRTDNLYDELHYRHTVHNEPYYYTTTDEPYYILDLCSGFGHTSFVLSRFFPVQKIVCLEYDIFKLYLLKKYFVGNANYICCWLQEKLPFKSEVFSKIIFADALNYFSNKQALASEVKRTLLKDIGVVLFFHLHNKLNTDHIDESIKHLAESPETYNKIFNLSNNWHTIIMSEEDLLKTFLAQGKLDLSPSSPDQTALSDISHLNVSSGLIAIATYNKSYFRSYNYSNNFFAVLGKNWKINPMYTVISEYSYSDKVVLKLKNWDFLHSNTFKLEFFMTKKHLPCEVVIDKAVLNFLKIQNSKIKDQRSKLKMQNAKCKMGQNYKKLENIDGVDTLTPEFLEQIYFLIKHFVIIDLPELYC